MTRMKRKERRSVFMQIGAVVLVLCLVAALALPAFAAETTDEDAYSYVVRIFPGDKGTIDGGTDPIVKEVEAGYEWTRSDFDYRSQAASKTDRYYVSGMRESGKDNNTNGAYKGGAFTVDHDIDLVISYAIKGSDVAYTINYVDVDSGTSLRDSETYYGNVGDKPAVAYLYIEGYVPQYKNITGTLQSDASANEWTFYYVKKDDGNVKTSSKSGSVKTQSTGTSGSATTTGGSSTGTSASTATGSSTTTNSTATGSSTTTNSTASESGTATGTAAANTGTGTTVNTLRSGPQEIVDIDVQDVPLIEEDSADNKVTEAESEIVNTETEGVVRANGMPGPVKVIIGAAVVLAIAAAGWFFLKQSGANRDE